MGYTIWTTKTELDNIEMHGKGGGGGRCAPDKDFIYNSAMALTLPPKNMVQSHCTLFTERHSVSEV